MQYLTFSLKNPKFYGRSQQRERKNKNPSDEVNAKFALLVQKKIAAEGVNRLSTREWTVVIHDVISDEEEMSAAYEKRQRETLDYGDRLGCS